MARILTVDDSFIARQALQKIIIEMGHTVVSEAANGAQAFTEYVAYRPDIVTMDLRMPGISGAAAMSKIIGTFPEARIIVVSASDDRFSILDALERGARHYLTKPFSPEKVAATLDNVLKQKFDRQKYQELARKLKETEGFLDKSTACVLGAAQDRAVRFLVVDDSSVARKSLREIVTLLGHTVVCEAENGAQAFTEYALHKPDVVTMDLTMQGMNGAEATSKIIATFPEAKIIVISATEEREAILDALERGARHFIIKPITHDKVAAVLHNVINQKFDPRKHAELVQKLKGASNPVYASGNAPKEYLPPYEISKDNGLLLVKINSTLTVTSCQSLSIEFQEYLTENPKVLIDFGATKSLSEAALAAINNLIDRIEKNSGVVKAVSRNRQFTESCALTDKCPSLAGTIRYFAK